MSPSDETPRAASLELRGVSKRYASAGQPVVNDLSFVVPAGAVCMLVGPSGCGKTTTLRMINRLVEPTSGQILLDGRDVMAQDAVAVRRRIGYVIQQVGLFPHLTVAANVAVVPQLLGWSRERRRARANELLDLVGLDPAGYGRRYPRELSGGERQRVGVARALAGDPPLLLMDEPFGAVDPIVRERLQNELLTLQRSLAKTIVFVTHDIDEAIKLGDYVAVFNAGGTIAQFGSPDEILARPASDFVARFVGADRGLKRLALTTIEQLRLVAPATPRAPVKAPAFAAGTTLREALSVLLAENADAGVALDGQGRARGLVTLDEITGALQRDARDGIAIEAESGSGDGAAPGRPAMPDRRRSAGATRPT